MKCLITGVSGMDGSLMAQRLVDEGCEVHGVVRRHAVQAFPNLAALLEKDAITLHEADLADQNSLNAVVADVKPEEVYNLAAQSYVGVSYTEPEHTLDVTGLGALRVFEAVRRHAPTARVYQASSSEMFGNALWDAAPEARLDEDSPMWPESPYGVAKLAAHNLARIYREAYRLHISSGILFNHECFAPETPVLIRRGGLLDVTPIADLMPNHQHQRQRALGFEVWDAGGWTQALVGTATWNGPRDERGTFRVIGRSGEVVVTGNHKLITEDGEAVEAAQMTPGMSLKRTTLPPPPGKTKVTPEWAEFLGLMVAEGWAGYAEGKYNASFRNNDAKLLNRVQELWEQVGGTVSEQKGVSGFSGEPTGGLRLNGVPGLVHLMADEMYTRQVWKRVPRVVLNADGGAWLAFLRGYNYGDGLRAGHQRHEFRNFKTSSPTLAAGVWWMASQILRQKMTLNVDFVQRGDVEYGYYSINLGVPGGSVKGQHLLKPPQEVKQVRPIQYTGWVFDVATQSKTLHAGVGDLVVHNSETRGAQFVTRKITLGLARIKHGRQKELRLGNVEAVRDWGYAPEYVEGMTRILRHETPGDWVLATGEGHTVEEFLHAAMDAAGLPRDDETFLVTGSQRRPTDIERLVGNPQRAQALLGWSARTRFPELVKKMVKHDLDLVAKGGA